MATDLELERPAGSPPSDGPPPGPRRRKRGNGGVILIGVAAVVLGLLIGGAWASGALGYAAWWLTNTDPPVVGLAGPPAAVRGSTEVRVQLSPRSRIVRAQVDDRALAVGAEDRTVALDTATLADGRHRVVVEAEDLSFRKNRAQAEYELRSDNTPPQLTLDAQPVPVPEGHTWFLRVQTDEPAAVEATLDGRPLDLQAGDGFGWAIVGIGVSDEPRDVPLAVSGADPVGNRSEQRGTMRVAASQYPKDDIEVPAALQPLVEPQVRVTEDARLAPTYAKVSQPRLWDGAFRMPVQGEIITQYGEVRTYNKIPNEVHHTGVDIAVPLARPVLAPARGRVVLVDQVPLRGNMLIVDHGLGVFTTYAHLSAVDVQLGQEVQAGQPIAKVGSTGLSQGPHLHWELWIRGVNVDPLEWTKRSYP